MSDSAEESVAETVQRSVDFSDTVPHELAHSSETAEVLSETQRQTVLDSLHDEFRDTSRRVRELSYSWKDSSYSDDGQTLERIYDEAFDVDAPVRNDELDGRGPRGDEPELVRVLHSLSIAALEHHHGQNTRLYRGVGTHDGLCDAAEAVLGEDDSAETLSLTVLSNFTSKRQVADHYGTLVVETELEPEEVALAADFLLPVEGDDQIDAHDAEYRIFGEAVVQKPSHTLNCPISIFEWTGPHLATDHFEP